MTRLLRRFALLALTLLLAPCASAQDRVQAQPAAAPAYDAALFQDLSFRTVGPTRGGRVTAVAGHPAHPHTFYMGATGGGVWKTADAGQSWTNLSDGFFATPSIGAIQVAPSAPNVIYVGTGSDGIRSNVISGKGLYKSKDAGQSWSFIGLPEAGQIGGVAVHPNSPDTVFAAALGHPFGKNEQRGVFRSTDGGASWTNVLFASDSTGAIDIEMNPADPDLLYAAMWRGERKPWTIISGCAPPCQDGLYTSTDGGDTWRRVTAGLPQGLIGKINIAVTPADPDRVYALVEAPEGEEGLYRSDDRGESWRLVNTREGLMTRPFYFTNITAHPTDPDVVYVGNVRNYKSTDAGASFTRVPATHADVHDLWINPEQPDLMIQGNDGGATVSVDGGATWSTQHNQPTAELYQVEVDDQFPYWLYAGQQDNSTIAVPSLPPAARAPAGPEGWWRAIGGCETGPAVPKIGDPSIIYANCKGRFGRYNRTTGQEKQYWVGAQYMYGRNPTELMYRFQRVVPIEISPHDSSTVYHGSQYVHRTTDDGVTWDTISPDLTAFKPQFQMASGGPITRDITGEEHYSTLYEIEVSPHDPQVIWTGANDGPVHVTRDGGDTWQPVTPPGMPPNGRIDAIEPSPHQPGTAYLAMHRRLLDDFAPYVYKTADYGQTWTRLADGTNGIPAGDPVRVVREDPSREGLLYAGTDAGVFVSFDDGQRWQPLQNGLPTVPITEILVHDGDLVLSTMGRGFWVLDDLTPLRRLSEAVATAEAHLFAPRDAHRMRYRASRGSGAPQFPAPGAIIDYYLAEAPVEEVRLEIVDRAGTVLRAFSSYAEQDTIDAEPYDAMALDEPVAEAIAPLPAKAGHNRFRWNLRYPSAWSDGTHGSNGPMVAPGAYRVRLHVGSRTQTRPLRVRIDPRVQRDGVTRADLEEQLQFNLRLRDAISRARQAAAAMEPLQAELAQAGRPEAAAEVGTLHSQLVTAEDGSYPPPMLIDQLEYLSYMTTSADQKVGQDAFDRFKALETELTRLTAQWDRLQQRLQTSEATGMRD